MSGILLAKIVFGIGIFQILYHRIKANGVVAGAILSVVPIIMFLFSFGLLFIFLGGFVLAANQYEERQTRPNPPMGKFFDSPREGLEYSLRQGTDHSTYSHEFNNEEEAAVVE